jgi:hypothetical protein
VWAAKSRPAKDQHAADDALYATISLARIRDVSLLLLQVETSVNKAIAPDSMKVVIDPWSESR